LPLTSSSDSLKWASLSLPEWIKGILSPNCAFGIPVEDSHFFRIYAAVLCDIMWFSRNQAVHKSVIPKVTSLADKIRRVALEHYAAWSSILKPITEAWIKPPLGWCKVNFDAAIREDFSTQAAVCRNSNGVIIKTISQVSPPCSPVYGEAQAAKLAGVLADSLHLENFILEGDSALVVLALQNPALTTNWHIEHLINETLATLHSSKWEARKINRSANFCAHYVAYRAVARVIPSCIPFSFPLSSIPICSGKCISQ
jgi:hypothetical protein